MKAYKVYTVHVDGEYVGHVTASSTINALYMAATEYGKKAQYNLTIKLVGDV